MREFERAEALYRGFTGKAGEPVAEVDAPEVPTVALVVGQCDFIGYTAVRDGEREEYIHRFHKADRPFLLSSPNGDQLFFYGGRFTFTERGITDESDPPG